jgi:O-antigen/teichoic acid export membrane protein
VSQEMRSAVFLTAAALPFVTVTSGLRGILEARLDFARLSVLRGGLGVATFAGPWLVSRYTDSLPLVVGPILAARIVSAMLHAGLVARRMPKVVHLRYPRLDSLAPLVRMGGWLTLSGILSPLMVSVDRFLVAAVLSASAVVFYSTPQEIVARFLIIPSAVLGVWFPALCHACADSRRHVRRLLFKGVCLIGAIVIPLAIVAGSWSYSILQFWLGSDFAASSASVLSILIVGLSVNALAHMPLAVLYAARIAHLPALFHLCELPLYLPMIYLLTRSFGVEGAAAAWTIRVAIDACLLFWVALRYCGDAQGADRHAEVPSKRVHLEQSIA